MDQLFAAGALDAWTSPAAMKKGRGAAATLHALCRPGQRAAVLAALFRDSASIGARVSAVQRCSLPREVVTVATALGPVRVKAARLGGRLVSAKPEYEDCAAVARSRGIPLAEVQLAAAAAFRLESASK